MHNYQLHCSECVVGIVTGVWSLQSRILFLAGTREFSLLQNNQTRSRIHPTPCTMGTRGSYPGTKARGPNVDCSPQSSAKVKKEYLCSPLHGVHRENFTFTFLLPHNSCCLKRRTRKAAHLCISLCFYLYIPLNIYHL